MMDFAKNQLNFILRCVAGVESVFDENFFNIVTKINETKGKIIFCSIGKSYWLSKKISATISSLGKASFCLHGGEALHGDLGCISREDSLFFVSNSGESKELISVISHCKSLGVQTFSLTSSVNSSIALLCNYNIALPQFSECLAPLNPPICASVLTLIIGDMLALCLANAGGFNALGYSRLHPEGKIGLLVTTIENYLEKSTNGRVCNKVASVSSQATIGQAIKVLNSTNVGIIAITNENNKVIACFSDGDLKRLITAKIDGLAVDFNLSLFSDCFAKFITKNPKTLSISSPLLNAVQIVKTTNISHILVVDAQNCLVDILKAKDFFKWL